MRNKKIAFFGIKYFPSKGGSSRIAEDIAENLRERYAITIYCYRHPDARTHMDGVRVVQFPKIAPGEFGVFIYYLCCCLHILFARKYDLIHAHKTDSAVFIPLLRLRAKVIGTSQEAPYLRDKWNWLGRTYMRFMEYFFIHASTLRTSVSYPLTRAYVTKYGKKVHYIPNGVSIPTPGYSTAADDILQTNEIQKGDPYLFFAARRIMSTKGCHTFLQAMHKIEFSGKILIAGEESHAKSYMRSITELSEGLDLSFLGYIDNKDILMDLADKASWFIFPSQTEGLSLMLLEIGCRGTTPILCSDIPENTSVFKSDEVLFFRSEDSADLADKFSRGNGRYDEMEKMATRARARVIRDFSSEAVAKKYEALYKEILYPPLSNNPKENKQVFLEHEA